MPRYLRVSSSNLAWRSTPVAARLQFVRYFSDLGAAQAGFDLYPSDAVAADKLVEAAARHEGIVYLRMTRSKTPAIYDNDEVFPIGGSKTVRSSDHDALTVVSAGYTLYGALAAYEELKKEDVAIRVVDLYSVKPLDVDALKRAAAETGDILVVEDHYAQGGIGEAVFHALVDTDVALHHLSAESLGLGRHPHPLAVGQPNTFVLFFLMLHKDSYLFPEIVNGLVEFFVDTVSQVRSEGNP